MQYFHIVSYFSVSKAFQEARSQYDVAFLKEWKTRWNNQKLIVQGLSKLFMYLVRSDEMECFVCRWE